MQMHMHVFVFSVLNMWMIKRKLMHKSELLFKRQLLTSFFSRQNEDNDDTLRFGIEKLLSTLKKLLIQIKYKSNSVINYPEQSNSLLWLKTTLATLSNQETTVQLRYFFVKENWKGLKIRKLFYSSLHNGGRIMARKGVSTEVYWQQTAKLLNRVEKSEEKPKSGGKISLFWSAHLLHRDSSMHPTYSTREVRCILISLKRGCDGMVRDFCSSSWSQFAAQFRDLGRASDNQ